MTMVKSPNHFNKPTDELSLFLPEKSALFIASENLAMISCLIVQSYGYSVHAASVILKYHINFFLQSSVRGEYCQGHLGKDAKTADWAIVKSLAETQKNALAAASTPNELFQNSM